MWLIRFRIGPALPRAFGCHRFIVGAAFATALFTRKSSGFSFALFVAFAIADFNVFSISRADFFGIARNTSSAADALLPRIKRATGPTFAGLIR
jgi:hypothetical protein